MFTILSHHKNAHLNYLRVQLTLIRMATYQGNIWEQMLDRMWGERSSHCWLEYELVQPLWK